MCFYVYWSIIFNLYTVSNCRMILPICNIQKESWSISSQGNISVFYFISHLISKKQTVFIGSHPSVRLNDFICMFTTYLQIYVWCHLFNWDIWFVLHVVFSPLMWPNMSFSCHPFFYHVCRTKFSFPFAMCVYLWKWFMI